MSVPQGTSGFIQTNADRMAETRAGGMRTAWVLEAAKDVQAGSTCRCHQQEGASSWGRALNTGTELGPSPLGDVEAEEVP